MSVRLFVFIVSLSWSFSLCLYGKTEAVDLSAWQGERIKLNEGWHYRDGLAENFDSGNWTPVELPVGFLTLSEGKQPFGSKSFYIRLNNLSQDIGIRYRADSSSRLLFFKDGEQPRIIDTVGKLSDSGVEIPKIAGRLNELKIRGTGDYHLLIQVENFDYHEGQIWQVPEIESYPQAFRRWNQEQIFEIFGIGMLFILTIYNICLFLQRMEEPANLWLSLFCVCMLMRTISTSAFLIDFFFYEPSWIVYYIQRKVEFGIVPAAAIFVSYFVVSAFRVGDFRLIKKALLWFSSLIVMGVIALPIPYLDRLVIPIDLSILLGFSTIVLVLVKSIILRKPGSAILAVGFGLFFLGVGHDLAIGIGWNKDGPFLGIYGMDSFILCLGLVVAKQFAIAFRTSERLTYHLEDEVDKKTRDIRSMLDNIQHGILSIIEGHRIHQNYSKHLESILENTDIANQNVFELIFEHSDLNSEQISLIDSTLNTAIGEDELNFIVNQDHLVNEFTYTGGGKSKVLMASWSAVLDKQEKVEKVLLVLRDISLIKKFEEESLEQKRELEYIIEIVNVSPEKFGEFIITSRQLIAENKRLVDVTTRFDEEIIKILFINLHTIKGAARTLRFNKMTQILHDIEQKFANLLRDERKSWSQSEVVKDTELAAEVIELYRYISEEKLGRTQLQESELILPRDFLEEQRDILRGISNTVGEDQAEILTNMVHKIDHVIHKDVADVFDDILRDVSRIAKDLGKENPVIDFSLAQPMGINVEGIRLVNSVFTHIIRNSLDHGIETSVDRIKKGKLPTGKINLQLEGVGDYCRITYYDDGKGLDLTKIKERAQQHSLLDPNLEYTPKMLAEFIFRSGFSTAKTLSYISGRGVGMEAVRNYVLEHGGTIDLELGQVTSGFTCPFKIVIQLPISYFSLQSLAAIS